MAIIWRHSALAHRHAEIGGELEDWNGMGTAWFYDHTPERAKADYEAIRTKAGLMDVSGLKKCHVTGQMRPMSLTACTTRNVEKIAPGRRTLCRDAELRRQVHRRLRHLPHRGEFMVGRASAPAQAWSS